MESEKVRVLVVEDEWITSEEIKQTLELKGVEVAGQADSSDDALAILAKERVDAAILDININGDIDGIELAHRINQLGQIPIIFLTAFDDKKMVERAKSVMPAAYMVKPFHSKNLLIAIEMAISNLAGNKEGESADDFILEDRIFIKENHLLVKIMLKDITHIEAVGSYTKIHIPGKSHTLSKNLKTFESRLDNKEFIRVHRSFVVNVSKIDAINGNLIYINDFTLPIGSAHRNEVLERFKII